MTTSNRKPIATLAIETNNTLLSVCLFFLRLSVGTILFIAGAGKVLGWFGGFGMDMTIQFYGKMGISIPFTYLSAYTEFIGGALLVVGLLTRPAAVAVTINMLVATILTLPGGFLVPNGASYPFIFLVIAVVVLLAGPMSHSVDALLASILSRPRRHLALVSSRTRQQYILSANR